jgi:uncharacterized protein (DUF433 family)
MSAKCIMEGRPVATHLMSAEQFLGSLDARAFPRYGLAEASVYLGLNRSTLHAWFYGTTTGKKPLYKEFRRILTPASPELLSFYDLASAHVLMALKKKSVQPEVLRLIVESLEKEFPDERYPLLGKKFHLFGRQLILKKLGQRLNLSRARQLGFKTIMDRFLDQLELDKNKMPLRFSPIKGRTESGRAYFVIDPSLAAGVPVIRGTGVSAEIIARRRNSGESIEVLAKDYRIPRRAITEAVRYFPKKAA